MTSPRAGGRSLIGLDVGTTGCKAVVFSEEGDVRGSAYREYGVETDRSGKAEQDPEQVWKLTREVLREALASPPAGRPSLEVAGLSVSVQGDAIIPLDGAGRPVYPAILGMDYRSAPQARACEARYGGEALFRRTGMRPHPINSLCKILWLREERPEAWARTRRITTYADFILGRLGAPGVIDRTMASRTMAFDLDRGGWAEDLLKELGLRPELLSEPVQTGTAVGRLDPELTRDLGVEGAPVLVTGAHDQPAGAIGAGVLSDGDAVISTGTAEVLSTVFSSRAKASSLYAGYYPCYESALPGRWFTFSLNHVGGLLLRWYRDTWAAAEVEAARAAGRDPYEVILDGLPEGPSPLLFLPHLNGAGTPSCDPVSRGAIVGLTLASTRADVAKAILDCQSYELAINLAALREAGISVRWISAVGGGARSSLWLQVKADVLGVPIRTVRVPEAACLGAAIFAGAGAGVFESVAAGAQRAVRVARVYDPRPAAHDAYAARLAVYRDLHPALRPIHQRLQAQP
ncbi:MAG TPA: FGGY-family carbohydrate kinase [Anaeromyxobacter sp.]|nr:FGGY-family carbohydrate kinase [Anaeromyxobacter sp.]